LTLLVPGHLDVSSITPSTVPAVLNEPVVRTILSSISNDKDTVVEITLDTVSAAGSFIVDTTGVELEALLGGINSNGDWLLSNCSLEGSLIIRSDSLVARNGSSVWCLGLAGLVISKSVWPGSLRDDSLVADDILKGSDHVTTTVAVKGTVVDTIDELFLREGD